MRRNAILSLATFLGAASCASPVPPADRATAVSVPPAAASEALGEQPLARSAPAVEGPRGELTCGNARCQLGRESCCTVAGASRCVRNAPLDPPGEIQLLSSQIEECQLHRDDLVVEEIARCRGSDHCPAGQLCCSQSLFGGATAVVCRPATPSEVSCDYGEVCTAELACRSPGSRCVRGRCAPSKSIECGGRLCDLTSSHCVAPIEPAAAPRCLNEVEYQTVPEEARRVLDVTCVRHSDCLPREHCQIAAVPATFCQRAEDGNSARLCDTVADCDAGLCAAAPPGQRQLVCAKQADRWHAVCGCR